MLLAPPINYDFDATNKFLNEKYQYHLLKSNLTQSSTSSMQNFSTSMPPNHRFLFSSFPFASKIESSSSNYNEQLHLRNPHLDALSSRIGTTADDVSKKAKYSGK